MKENLFWCILGILGGGLFSLLFFILSLKRKILEYKIVTTEIISPSISQLENLKIKYNKTKLTTLYSSTIDFQNKGNTIIETNDFSPSYPLSIMTNGEFIINQNGEINQDVDNDKFSLIYDETYNDDLSKRAILQYEYIPKRNSFTLLLFHTEPIRVSGKLKDGKIIQIKNSSNTLSYSLIISAVLLATITALLTSIFVFYSNNEVKNLLNQSQINYENLLSLEKEINYYQDLINKYEKMLKEVP